MNKYNFCGFKPEEVEEQLEVYFMGKYFRVLKETDTIKLDADPYRVNLIVNKNGYIIDIYEG